MDDMYKRMLEMDLYHEKHAYLTDLDTQEEQDRTKDYKARKEQPAKPTFIPKAKNKR